jgi:NAD(P)-dependent dehydrogenase (short-subunit alcohol dehydrogenase family)
MVEHIIEEFGRLDFACNNAAGGGHPPTPLAEVPIEAFHHGHHPHHRRRQACRHATIPSDLGQRPNPKQYRS